MCSVQYRFRLVSWLVRLGFLCVCLFFSSVFQSAVELIYGHRAYGRGSLTVYSVCLVPLLGSAAETVKPLNTQSCLDLWRVTFF